MIPVLAARAKSIRNVMADKKLKLGRYRHYKGGEYEVIGIAKDHETLEDLVVYRALYGKHVLWVRPLEIFQGEVEINNKKIPRFQYSSTSETNEPQLYLTRRSL